MELITNLYKGLKRGEKHFISTYLDIEDEFVNWYNNSDILKSDIYINQQVQLKDLLFISTIFSDVTSIYLMNRLKSEFKIQYLPNNHPNYGKTVTIPSELGLQISSDSHVLLPAYIYWPTLAIKRLLSSYGNLIKNQKAIIRPMRIMLVKDKIPENNPEFTTYFVNPNTPTGNWIFEKELPRNSIPFSYTNLPDTASKIFEIVLPLTTNITEKKLMRLLNNEKQHLSAFRKSILNIVDNYIQSDISAQYVLRDHIKPEISKLEIEYKELLKKTGIRIASNIAYSLSLFRLSNNPDSETIAAIIGAGSLGYGILGATDKYLKYLDEKSSIKENPFYLFWRLDRINN